MRLTGKLPEMLLLVPGRTKIQSHSLKGYSLCAFEKKIHPLFLQMLQYFIENIYYAISHRRITQYCSILA